MGVLVGINNRRVHKFIVGVILCLNINAYAQNLDEPMEMDFFVVDTIQISNPLILRAPGRAGEYLLDLEKTSADKITKNKLHENQGVYIYDESLHTYLGYKNFEQNFQKYPYKDGESGCILKESDLTGEIKGYEVRNFEKPPVKYILALIRCDYYNKKNATYGMKGSLLQDVNGPLYYRLVFPICE